MHKKDHSHARSINTSGRRCITPVWCGYHRASCWISAQHTQPAQRQESVARSALFASIISSMPRFRRSQKDMMLQYTDHPESSRKIGIISLSVLSHHPAYRSVQGGSLIYNAHISVVVREKQVASAAH